MISVFGAKIIIKKAIVDFTHIFKRVLSNQFVIPINLDEDINYLDMQCQA